jgi:carboxypeptidase Taq
VLTPAEALGLSGAALSARVRRALMHETDASLGRVMARLRSDAAAEEVVYEHAGVMEPVRIMLRPLLAMPDQLTYVHHICTKLTDALKRLPDLYLADPEVRRVLRIRDDEAAFLRAMWRPEHARDNAVYGRLDAVCDFESSHWQSTLQFMEPNLSGVGGIHFAPLAESLVLRDVGPVLRGHDPSLHLALPRDQRELFVQLLLEHAAALGRPGRTIALIEPKYAHDGPNEQPVLAAYMRAKHGLTVVHADPRELRVEHGEVMYEEHVVDVAYRDYETRDLLALEAELGQPLSAMRLLFSQNRVVSSLVGDFDHKSCWELLTDESLAARHFSAEERRVFRRHVLWTRLVGERSTSLPDGETGELLTYARQHREDLVLKPNRGYGGVGVHVGAATTQPAWEMLLTEAARSYEDPERAWVLQARTQLPVVDFPVLGEGGRVHDAPFYAVMGFAATDGGLGILCRVSQKHVVNVAQYGGLAAVLVGNAPSELFAQRRPAPTRASLLPALRERIRELRHLDQALGLLGWDEETYLPDGARTGRGEQLGTLESMRHSLLTSERLGDLMDVVSAEPNQDADLHAELRALSRLRHAALRLPDALVRAIAEARSHCLAAWESAREQQEYGAFQPAFSALLGLVRERAQHLADGGDPYDALLDEHEPGMTRARMEPVLLRLREALVPRVQRMGERPRPTLLRLHGLTFSDAGQWDMCVALLERMGFSFERGRLDRSSHPFTLAAGSDDVRLTIRVAEDYLPAALFATLHEGGHGLYDQGFLPEDRERLLSDAPSMGLHESQARLWENVVGRSRAFWQGFHPHLRKHFPEQLLQLDAEALYAAVNVVEPSLIRVEADEVTYNLHILLRYELEVQLLCGALAAKDLPDAWAEKTRSYFGLTPRHVREGCLQDVHWALGTLGYFPTYTFGNLYAAQLAEAYGQTHDLAGELSRFELLPLSSWLRREVQRHGMRFGADELVERITGKGLDAEAFLRALAEKHDG